MRRIDSLAYASRLVRLHPAWKAGCSLSAILAALLLGRIEVSLSVLAGMACLSVAWGGVPTGTVVRLLAGEATFLALAVAGVAVSVGTTPPAAGGFEAGPVWIATSGTSLAAAADLLARAMACAAAMSFLALTTPMIAIVDLLRSLRVSALLVDLVTLVYRFIFVLHDTFGRMVLAEQARLGLRDARTTLAGSGRIGAGLFASAFRRSRRIEHALCARGWDSTLQVLPGEYEHPRWARSLVARLAR